MMNFQNVDYQHFIKSKIANSSIYLSINELPLSIFSVFILDADRFCAKEIFEMVWHPLGVV
jgi:hypothetical protein